MSMPNFGPLWWRDKNTFIGLLSIYGNCTELANRSTAEGFEVTKNTVQNWARKFEIPLRRTTKAFTPVASEDEEAFFITSVHALLNKPVPTSIPDIADELDVPPKRVRQAVEILRMRGFRIPDEEQGSISIQKIAPAKNNLHKSVLEGNEIEFGVVSDTHLSSNEEALEELHLAYDVFEERGISQVFHAGDWTCGSGIFRGQIAEIKNHTFESQVEYLVKNYPHRPGILTSGISGNHDIEGDFGRIGANPVVALANRRDDIEFLGDYSAYVNLHTDEHPTWLHLLHGKGGMSYAYSYKAQKIVEGYSNDRRPAMLAVGHWHVAGQFEARGTQVLFPACFEWQSPFLERLGLNPAVGFTIIKMTIGDDGEIVQIKPEYYRFREARELDY